MKKNPLFSGLKSNQFFNYFFSIFLTFLAVSILLGIGYAKTNERLTTNKIRDTLTLMKLFCGEMDTQITNAYLRLSELANEDEIVAISNLSDVQESGNYFKFLSAQQKLQTMAESDLIAETAIFFPDEEPLMLTSQHIITNLPLHYQSGLYSYSDMTYDEFINRTTNAKDGIYYDYPEVSLHAMGERNVITYQFRMQVPGTRQRPVAILFFDIDKIFEKLSKLIADDQGWICLTDAMGSIIAGYHYKDAPLEVSADNTANNVRPVLSGSQLFVASSRFIGINYYLYLPDSMIQSQIQPIHQTLLTCLVIAIFLGVVLSIVIAWYNQKPLLNFVNKISFENSTVSRSNFVPYIEQYFDHLQKENSKINRKLSLWQETMKQGVLDKLLRGIVISRDEFEILDSIKRAFPKTFAVAIITWSDYPNQCELLKDETVIMDVYKQIRLIFEKGIFIHSLTLHKLAFIVDASESYTQLDNRFYDLVGVLSGEHDFLFSVVVGNIYTDITDTYRSCYEARSLFPQIKDWHSKRVWRYHEDTRSQLNYDFSFEYMNKILLHIRNADKVLLQKLLHQIYTTNFVERAFIEDDIIHFYADCKSIWDRLMTMLDNNGLIFPPIAENNPQDIYTHILESFLILCSNFHKQKKLSSQRLVESLVLFVEENYTDSAISLKMLSAQFHMSDKYLSLFFKENVGCKFSEYLENKRLEEAVKLMTNSKLLLNDIQTSVGYTSSNTFYKAFKRKYGISPSVWRENTVK